VPARQLAQFCRVGLAGIRRDRGAGIAYKDALLPEAGMPDGTASAHLYRPKLATILREGYDGGKFSKDLLAAL
jgi:hypothetical protein